MAAGASASGTASYPGALTDALPDAHFRGLDGLTVASIGLGTYLGDEDDETDGAYGEAIVDAVFQGTNCFDTAINYRAQRSERVLGRVIASLVAEGAFRREQIVVATKGGYLPFDGVTPRAPAAYLRDTYFTPGIIAADDVAAGCHAMTPRYLDDQIERSRRNLGLDTIDVYYVHNPETQLAEVSRVELMTRIRAAFEGLERAVADGRIGRYGVATWDGLRKAPEAREHLSLAALVQVAADVGGAGHHFRVVQLPYNLGMPEAAVTATQVVDGERVTVLEAARRLDVSVVASAAILQGQLARRLSPAVAGAFPDLDTDAQRALQFARSTPGITTALVGMSSRRHVAENLAVARMEPAPAGVDSLLARR
jgi:aryl-alcohol dehydrogenase-like predicted oxidoreductase